MFSFYQNCKKCHFWQFIAPFGSQLRQMVFECLVRAVLFRTYSEFYSELNSQEAYQICGSNTFHLPFCLAPSRCKTPFFFNSAMYFSIWQADIPHCSANCLAEMEASARMNRIWFTAACRNGHLKCSVDFQQKKYGTIDYQSLRLGIIFTYV